MTRGRWILLAVPVIGCACWYFWPLDAETGIRRSLSRLESAFDRGSSRSLVSFFDENWTDNVTGASREDVRGYFAGFVLNQRHPKTRGFLYDIDIDEDAMDITLHSKSAATVDIVFSVLRNRSEGDPVLVWRLAVRAELERNGRRWMIQKSERKTLDGRRPF